MNKVPETETRATPWSHAARLLERWLEQNARVDELLESLPRSLTGVERGRCQGIVLGAIRHCGRIEAHLVRMIATPPRARLQAVLLAAGFELIEGGDEHHTARVVHHAVEQTKTLASPPEARLVNAVVRKLAAALAAETAPAKTAPALRLAEYFSHPEWLVKRWLADKGAEATRSLLEWNQRPAPVYARWRLSDQAPSAEEEVWLAATPWPQFFEVKPGHWPAVEAALAAGRIYLQDPATRLAVGLLAPQVGETVLDVCAAPGGKSLAIADTLIAAAAKTRGSDAGAGVATTGETESEAGEMAKTSAGKVVALELPGTRVERLKENLARVSGVEMTLVEGDLGITGARLFEERGLPKEFSAVLVDVPCSNTGVMAHRVDVKWRLQAGDFPQHARQQLALLRAAAECVAPKGRLVYSTCSLEAEENAEVVQAFLAKSGGRFVLESSAVSYPWESGHDGAGAFLLRRV